MRKERKKSEKRRDDYDFRSNDENWLLPEIKDINNSALAIKNKSELPLLKAGHRKDSELLNNREAAKLKQLESRSDLKESMVNIKRKLMHSNKRDASAHGT